jgi:hypothetical protein
MAALATPTQGHAAPELNRPHIDSVTRTLRFKAKTECYPWLNTAGYEVNQVWNWAAEVSEKAARPCTGERKWLTGFDLNNLSAGATEHFDKIGADTIQRVNGEYAEKRRIAKRIRLKWRTSRGPRRSLGRIPFKAASLKRKDREVNEARNILRRAEWPASVRERALVLAGSAEPSTRSRKAGIDPVRTVA